MRWWLHSQLGDHLLTDHVHLVTACLLVELQPILGTQLLGYLVIYNVWIVYYSDSTGLQYNRQLDTCVLPNDCL